MVDAALKTLVGLMLALGVCLVLYAAELRFPRGSQATNASRINAIKFALVSAPLFTIAGLLVGQIEKAPPINAEAIGVVWAALLALVAYDFLYYWLHRAQHGFAMLWRFHAVHHSLEEMGVPKGYHHVTEPFLKALFCALPLSFFVSGGYVGTIVLLQTAHGYYLHSTTRLNFGRFAWLVADNRVHRLHHAIDDPGRNFGGLFFVWDRLFGTARFPQSDEWPVIGLPDRREPQSVFEFVFMRPDARRTMNRLPLR